MGGAGYLLHPPIIFLCIPYLASNIFMPSTAPLPDNFYFYTTPAIATISLLFNCTYCLTFILKNNLITQPF